MSLEGPDWNLDHGEWGLRSQLTARELQHQAPHLGHETFIHDPIYHNLREDSLRQPRCTRTNTRPGSNTWQNRISPSPFGSHLISITIYLTSSLKGLPNHDVRISSNDAFGIPHLPTLIVLDSTTITPSTMSTVSEKPITGVEIIHPQVTTTPKIQRPLLSVQQPSDDGVSGQAITETVSRFPTPSEEYDPTSTHPFSAFYSHPTTRTSFEQLKHASKTHIAVYTHNLESGTLVRASSEPPTSNKECTVWPGKLQLQRKNLLMEKRRGCSPWRNLTKKQKLWAQILIAFIIIGAAVGIGVGISKAVGGGVWKSNNSQTPIGDGD